MTAFEKIFSKLSEDMKRHDIHGIGVFTDFSGEKTDPSKIPSCIIIDDENTIENHNLNGQALYNAIVKQRDTPHGNALAQAVMIAFALMYYVQPKVREWLDQQMEAMKKQNPKQIKGNA